MIKAKDLTRYYGSFCAADHVSFKVSPGEVLGFLGPNGAGKSTTMKMLTGFLNPTFGTSTICGYDILQNPIAAKQQMGYLPENGPLYEEMTVLEFLSFVAALRDLKDSPSHKAIERGMDICGLYDVRHQPIETLSKGFRQRVGMAQAVLHDPPCLILDEPTDGLDPNQKQQIRALINQMAADKAIILSTHILEEVEATCSRIIIIDHGKVMIDEPTHQLLKSHPNYNAVRLTLKGKPNPDIRSQLEALSSVRSVESANDGFLVLPKKETTVYETLWEIAHEQKWPVQELRHEPIRLEKIFADLTESGNQARQIGLGA